MKFTKEFLQDFGGDTVEGFPEIIDTSRWSIHYRRVFEYKGHFYETFYSEGATEMQEERPYEYEADPIECNEVFPKQKLVTVYEAEE